MFSDLTDTMDEMFLMEFFRQIPRKYKEKNFKKKAYAFREFIRACKKMGITKTTKLTPILTKRFTESVDPTLSNLAKEALHYFLSGMMPRDVVSSYPRYCNEVYGRNR